MTQIETWDEVRARFDTSVIQHWGPDGAGTLRGATHSPWYLWASIYGVPEYRPL